LAEKNQPQLNTMAIANCNKEKVGGKEKLKKEEQPRKAVLKEGDGLTLRENGRHLVIWGKMGHNGTGKGERHKKWQNRKTKRPAW